MPVSPSSAPALAPTPAPQQWSSLKSPVIVATIVFFAIFLVPLVDSCVTILMSLICLLCSIIISIFSRDGAQRGPVDEANADDLSLQIHSREQEYTVIHSIPISQFKEEGHRRNIDCAICLAEEGDWIKHLLCTHAFHVPCIDTWFQSHSNCPLLHVIEDPPSSNG